MEDRPQASADVFSDPHTGWNIPQEFLEPSTRPFRVTHMGELRKTRCWGEKQQEPLQILYGLD